MDLQKYRRSANYAQIALVIVDRFLFLILIARLSILNASKENKIGLIS